jgi:hypothetical protein
MARGAKGKKRKKRRIPVRWPLDLNEVDRCFFKIYFLPIFFCGVFVRFSARGVQKHHKAFLGRKVAELREDRGRQHTIQKHTKKSRSKPFYKKVEGERPFPCLSFPPLDLRDNGASAFTRCMSGSPEGGVRLAVFVFRVEIIVVAEDFRCRSPHTPYLPATCARTLRRGGGAHLQPHRDTYLRRTRDLSRPSGRLPTPRVASR